MFTRPPGRRLVPFHDQKAIFQINNCPSPSPLTPTPLSFPPSLQEKQDKVVLLAEMANLRQNNQRLQEESLTASEQLRKFSRLLTNLEDTQSNHAAHSLAPGGDAKAE